jgi:hypothetical protein
VVVVEPDATTRWVLTFPEPVGSHGEQETVVVEQRAGYGPHGFPVYADADFRVRVEIEDGGLVHVLTCLGRPAPEAPLHALPLG